MDWKDLKPILGGSAPLIGKLIGVGASFIPGVGPIIGPIIGPAIGNILAGVFGVPATPETVANAIASNPDEVVKAKLAAATDQIKAQYAWATAVETGELKLEEVSIAQTNETIRAEINSQEHWFYRAWRPSAGWLYVVMMSVFGALLAWAIAKTVAASTDPLAALTAAWPLFVAYVSALAIVNGVLIPSRSIEKKAAIENGAAMPNAVPVPPPMNDGPAADKWLAVKKPQPMYPPSGGSKVIPAPAGSRT